MIVHLTINLFCFLVVTGFYARTVAAWVRRYGFNLTSQQWQPTRRRGMGLYGGQQVQQRQAKALWRLLAILFFFCATWLVVLVNDIAAVREGRRGHENVGMGDAPSTFMTVADAVILGGVLSLCWRCRAWFGPSASDEERDKAKGAAVTGRGRHASLVSLSQHTAEGQSRLFLACCISTLETKC